MPAGAQFEIHSAKLETNPKHVAEIRNNRRGVQWRKFLNLFRISCLAFRGFESLGAIA